MDKIFKAAKSGNPIKSVKDSNRRSFSSDTSSYKKNNSKSYVDYLRSKNTDASDVYYTTPKKDRTEHFGPWGLP